MTEIEFDSEVMSLIDDLGLVPGPVPDDFRLSLKRPKLCDIYKSVKLRDSAARYQLCKQLNQRNKNRKNVHFSYNSDSPGPGYPFDSSGYGTLWEV